VLSLRQPSVDQREVCFGEAGLRIDTMQQRPSRVVRLDRIRFVEA
jgi:hypothetical protein